MLVKKVSQGIPQVQGDRNSVPVSFPEVELVEKIAGIVAQGGGPTEISRCLDLSEAKHGPRSTPLVQGDRNGVPGSFPRVELVQDVAAAIARDEDRAQINKTLDLWEAKHGRLGSAKRSSLTK